MKTTSTSITCCPTAKRSATASPSAKRRRPGAASPRSAAWQEWPPWIPTAGEQQRLGPFPAFVTGGPHNPMGARGMYLYSNGKDTLYRIHGTNQPEYIGQAISSGCIRMTNENVMDLYSASRSARSWWCSSRTATTRRSPSSTSPRARCVDRKQPTRRRYGDQQIGDRTLATVPAFRLSKRDR